MRAKQGFILIECCAYLIICALLTLTIMQWVTQTVHEADCITHSIDRVMTSMVAQDVFMRDLQAAPRDRSAWIKIMPDNIIWRMSNGGTIGWTVHNKQLIRKEGTYNELSHQWAKHHTSAVAYGVTQFNCSIEIEDNGVRGVYSTLCIEKRVSQHIGTYVYAMEDYDEIS